MTILLVEQNAAGAAGGASRLCDGVGPDHHEGQAQQMLDDPRVKAAYLGEG
jgi:branched-chain amino acid transport system ATP-binding protein